MAARHYHMSEKETSETDTSDINTSDISESNTMTDTDKAQGDATTQHTRKWRSSPVYGKEGTLDPHQGSSEQGRKSSSGGPPMPRYYQKHGLSQP